jgi:hypothetical protein
LTHVKLTDLCAGPRLSETSIDFESSVSFGSNFATSRQHRLTPESVSRCMTVSFYSKKNKIKPFLLAEWKEGLKVNKNMRQNGKEKL